MEKTTDGSRETKKPEHGEGESGARKHPPRPGSIIIREKEQRAALLLLALYLHYKTATLRSLQQRSATSTRRISDRPPTPRGGRATFYPPTNRTKKNPDTFHHTSIGSGPKRRTHPSKNSIQNHPRLDGCVLLFFGPEPSLGVGNLSTLFSLRSSRLPQTTIFQITLPRLPNSHLQS